jgi:uncharacterized protein YuzE
MRPIRITYDPEGDILYITCGGGVSNVDIDGNNTL